MIYGKKGKYKLAIADFNSAIKINPQFAETYHLRGLAYFDQGKKELCIYDWGKAADLGNYDAIKKLYDFFGIKAEKILK